MNLGSVTTDNHGSGQVDVHRTRDDASDNRQAAVSPGKSNLTDWIRYFVLLINESRFGDRCQPRQ